MIATICVYVVCMTAHVARLLLRVILALLQLLTGLLHLWQLLTAHSKASSHMVIVECSHRALHLILKHISGLHAPAGPI